jgi:succinate dehydrogenase / fumarate reductase cytochrome b subunit
MKLLVRPIQTTVGGKYLMALTGLVLMGFVLGHMAGNLLIFGGKEALNSYAHGLASHPGFLWTARIILLIVFLSHIGLGIRSVRRDLTARPIPYVREKALYASWPARHMMLTGLVVLAFVIYHLLHFTFGVIQPSDFKSQLPPWSGPTDPKALPDVAGMVVAGFAQPAIALSYVFCQIFVALHLWHGGWSWFQHLGLNHRGYQRYIRGFGVVVALAVLAGNCLIPLSILFGWRPS